MTRAERVNQVMGGGERSTPLAEVIAAGEVSLLDALAWVVDEAILGLNDELAKARGEKYGSMTVAITEAVQESIDEWIERDKDALLAGLGV